MKSIKFIRFFGLFLLFVTVAHSGVYAGKGALELLNRIYHFPTVCTIGGFITSKWSNDQVIVNALGVQIGAKHVLTTTGGVKEVIDHSLYHEKSAKSLEHETANVLVSNLERESRIAKIYMPMTSEQRRVLKGKESKIPLGITGHDNRHPSEQLALLELVDPFDEMPIKATIAGENDFVIPGGNPLVWEDLIVGGVCRNTRDDGFESTLLRVPFALATNKKKDPKSEEHCLALASILQKGVDPRIFLQAYNPVDVGGISPDEMDELVMLYQSYLSEKIDEQWALEQLLEGAPVYSDTGALLGLKLSGTPISYRCKEIVGSFPIVTLCDPQTFELRQGFEELLAVVDEDMDEELDFKEIEGMK